jgi:hypothetical protein
VRFTTANAASGSLAITYIFEKNHAPVAFGAFEETEHSLAVAAQAKAFAMAYDRMDKAGPR